MRNNVVSSRYFSIRQLKTSRWNGRGKRLDGGKGEHLSASSFDVTRWRKWRHRFCPGAAGNLGRRSPLITCECRIRGSRVSPSVSRFFLLSLSNYESMVTLNVSKVNFISVAERQGLKLWKNLIFYFMDFSLNALCKFVRGRVGFNSDNKSFPFSIS